ncbi:MAG: hemolysin family protein [Paracoccus sp. (in: a-proteobacteria)]|nr:hemolysin family protein [Paracoccus sp. (in: a-proteobacteria)]
MRHVFLDLMWLEIAFIALLTAVNFSLAMAELALVSARPHRLRQMAGEGDTGARRATQLMERPGRVLSTVQIGITLVGILNGAFSGATIGARLGDTLAAAGVAPGLAAPLGIGIVVAIITAISILIGELVPKQIALSAPERIAARMAPGVDLAARIAAPAVWLIDNGARLVLRALGVRPPAPETITEEELRLHLAEATRAGVIGPQESRLIHGVMRIADLSARGLMTPIERLCLIDLTRPPDEIFATARRAKVTRLPAHRGNPQEIAGAIALRDLVGGAGAMPDPETLLSDVPHLPDTAGAGDVLAALQSTPLRLVMIRDSDARVIGAVSTMDLLGAMAGGFTNFGDLSPGIQPRARGGWLVSGRVSPADLTARTGFPPSDAASMEAFVLDLAGRLPSVGETFETGGWTIEVADLDGLQLDKLIISGPQQGSETAEGRT